MIREVNKEREMNKQRRIQLLHEDLDLLNHKESFENDHDKKNIKEKKDLLHKDPGYKYHRE